MVPRGDLGRRRRPVQSRPATVECVNESRIRLPGSPRLVADELPWRYDWRMAIHEVLAAKRDDVMLRWKAQVQATLVPDAMPSLELINHIPEFLDEIFAALRADAGLSSVGPAPEESTSSGAR